MGIMDRNSCALGQFSTPMSGVYAASAQRLVGDEVVPLSRFRGKVLVVVNVASE